jgi:hypothetical protein
MKISIIALITFLITISSFVTGCWTTKKYSEPKLSIEEERILKETRAVKITISARSEWGAVKYHIEKDIREKIAKVGLKVIQEDGQVHDATLCIDYKETKGGRYYGGGFGTNVWCKVWLYHEQLGKTIFKTNLYGSPPSTVRGSLYSASIRSLKNDFEFKYLGELIAVVLSKPIETSKLVAELPYGNRKKAIQLLARANWIPESPVEKAMWAAANERWEECITIGQPAVDPLIKMLNSRVVNKSKVAWVLGEIGDKRAVMPLIDNIGWSDDRIKLQVIIALGKLKDDRALGLLGEYVNYKNKKIAEAAREAIKMIRSQ